MSGDQKLGRDFRFLMVTQFLGALNDNIFKLAVSLVIVASYSESAGGGSFYLSLSQALFVLPFILFSSYAGFLADRFSKVTITRATKWMELVVMGFGCYFLYHLNIPALMIVLFLMGVHSALFSPSKYGLLPELLDRKVLSRGNGYIELWTFLAIVLGTAIAAPLRAFSQITFSHPGIGPGLCVVTIAVVGLLFSYRIREHPAVRADQSFEINPFSSTVLSLREIRENHSLFLTLLAATFFYLIASLVQLNLISYASQAVKGDDLYLGMLLTAVAVGIGAGSVFAGRVSAGKVELGLVPLGAIGIAITGIAAHLAQHHPLIMPVSVGVLGFCAGVYIVPLNSHFQHVSPVAKRGRFLAALNVCSNLAVFASAVLFSLMIQGLEIGAGGVFLVVGIVTACAAIVICRTIPQIGVRCVNWCLAHLFYRLKVLDADLVPAEGGALIICNHVSFVDPPLLLSALERPVRFLMYRPIYSHWWVKPFAKVMGAIPVDPEDSPKELLRSLLVAREAIENGEVVCIFAEGAITRIGQLLPFNRGFERIMKGLAAPIIPAYLDQVWGSIFSFHGGKFLWKIPKELPFRVTLKFGTALPSTSKSYEVRQAVSELGAEAIIYRRRRDQVLHTAFLAVCRWHPLRTAVVDSLGSQLSFISLAARAIALREMFKNYSPKVGVLLPPSAGAVIANVALLLAGKVPVNLNYTAGPDSLSSAIRQSEIKQVITNRAFKERLGEDRLNGVQFPQEIYLEDIGKQIRKTSVVIAGVSLLLLPLKVFENLFKIPRPEGSALATIIFSSGSTGDPKGVMLSHRNISSNLESIYDIFQLGAKDTVLGVLPFFHSFGFTNTLWLPLLGGFKAVYHNNPMEAGTIGELVEKHRATILMATPTFLAAYLRKCTTEQFSSLRYVIVGAEKLRTSLAENFKERFGIYPLEGYGCTELSPVGLINLPDFESGDSRQVGRKLGSVGHPLPGVAVRIVDPESYELLRPESEGLLLVKGPNVMVGYLGNEQKTQEVMRDGWYVTGDIAKMDEDGFVVITDRMSRFSKIGGEMVPHIRVEEEIQKALGVDDTVIVVTAVPDEKRGERLVVLSTVEFEAGKIVEKLQSAGLPALWIPKPNAFLFVDALPLLGSGKLDLRGVKKLALERAKSD